MKWIKEQSISNPSWLQSLGLVKLIWTGTSSIFFSFFLEPLWRTSLNLKPSRWLVIQVYSRIWNQIWNGKEIQFRQFRPKPKKLPKRNPTHRLLWAAMYCYGFTAIMFFCIIFPNTQWVILFLIPPEEYVFVYFIFFLLSYFKIGTKKMATFFYHFEIAS